MRFTTAITVPRGTTVLSFRVHGPALNDALISVKLRNYEDGSLAVYSCWFFWWVLFWGLGLAGKMRVQKYVYIKRNVIIVVIFYINII